MSKCLATAALTLAFIAAGAFGITQAKDTGMAAKAARTTVIAKTSEWPPAGYFTAAPCIRTVCWDI